MNLSTRDRRALILLGAGLLVILILRSTVFGERQVTAVAAKDSIRIVERRLARVRQMAATIPGKEALLRDLQAEAAHREKAMIVAPTAQQAQAHLLETIRRVGKNEGIGVSGGDFPQGGPLGD